MTSKHSLRKIAVTALMLATVGLSACGRSGPPPLPPEVVERMRLKMIKDMKIVHAELDVNRDGKITCADSLAMKQKWFSGADLNRDQRLSSAEYRQLHFLTNSFLYYDFDKIDLNQDGGLTLPEITAVPNDTIRPYDSNNDCRVSDQELSAYLQQNPLNLAGKKDAKEEKKKPAIDPDGWEEVGDVGDKDN